MAPTAAAIAGLLKQAVYYHLDTLSYQNALFFAERLHAHDQRSPESAYLLAVSHFRLGDSRSAYEAARLPGCRGVHLGCSYIFAQACLDLERFKDGISALEKARPLWTAKCSIGRHTASSRAPYPDAAAVSCLLGKLYRAYDDKKRAVACFEDALKANPFMWDAFTSLCDMGVNVMVPNIFKLNEPFARSFDRDPGTPVPDSSGAGSDPLQRRNGAQGTAHDYDPFGAPHRSTAFQDVSSNNMMFVDPSENDSAARIGRYASSRHPSEGMETPTGSVPADVQTSRLPSEPPLAPVRRTRGQTAEPPLEAPPKMSYRLGARKRDRPQEQQLLEPPEPPIRPTALPPATTTERKRTASGHPVQPRPVNGEEPRRSARLLMNGAPRTTRTIANAPAVGAAPVTRELKKARPPISRIGRPGSSGTTTVGRVVSGNRKPPEETSMDIDQGEMPRTKEPIVAPAPPPPPPKPIEVEPIRSDEGLKWILDLLKKMASGYRLASMFQCQEALSAFASLPRSHQDTPWVLARMARAHYELANYAEAEKFFRRLRMIAPTRHEDMEYYSTVLWQLRKGTELSFLAHELTDSVWDSPQAWCVLGNAFSLDCEHEQALQCFKRAIQLHPKFAYAYTLQGHEHVENEEYDKALAAYRRAIAADKRHYNAYYGIGKVYEKLGNYDKALAHYHAALVIHPTHAVLICCMGTVLQRQKQIVQALPYFVRAVELAPRAPEMRSKKAGALLATGQLEEARRELMILRDAAPNNAQVHFLLAKLAKTLGDRRTAVRHFTIALSLDPKASGEIKNEIAGLEDDDMDDSMMH